MTRLDQAHAELHDARDDHKDALAREDAADAAIAELRCGAARTAIARIEAGREAAWKIAIAGGTPDEIEAADPHFFQDLSTVELNADLIEAHGEAA